MKELDKLITEIEAVENMYLDKKQVLKRLKSIAKKHEPWTKSIGIRYDDMSNGLKSSIDNIEAALSKTEKEVVVCNRVNRTDNNRCINCGAKTGHECQMKPDKSNYC